ncbi:SDR family oxidoreductase [Frateuria aurantia]
MRIFVTGATGFIGSRIVPQLLASGHEVLGLSRSDAGARWLQEVGADVHRGTLEDPASLSAGAAKADAVIHAAFDHDFSNFVANCAKDQRAIEALGAALQGTDRPLVITSGVGMGLADGHEPASEEVANFSHPNPRSASERAGEAMLEKGINVSVVRLPQVHDTVKQGLITPYIEICRQRGVVAYVGEGLNRWSAVHVDDAATVYRLAVERARAGARYHAVAEAGVSARAIAEVVAGGLGLPLQSLPAEAAAAHFGWMGMFVGMDLPASSALTRGWLGWSPSGPDLLDDLASMDYAGRPVQA